MNEEREIRGYVIRVEGRFISAILANHHPEKPVVYFKDSLEEAKTWQTPSTVRKARARAGRGGMILSYSLDKKGKRVLNGMLAKNGEVSL